MRVRALAGSRLRGAVAGRSLVAPLVALILVQLLGLSGPPASAAVSLVSAVSFALPVLAWAVRQVLDAEPDDQVHLSTLAVGGPVREGIAGLLAAYAVAAPLAVICAAVALLHADDKGVPARDAAAGLALALATALVAVAVGALAARAVSGTGGAAVVVLVAAPVLIAVVGLSGNATVTALVPRFDATVRAANAGHFASQAPALLGQILLWSAVVLGLRLVVRMRSQ